MKLKTRFLLFSCVLHGILIFILTRIQVRDQQLFLITEALFLTSLAFSVWMYRAIGKPFDIISSAIESLNDKDFSSKLNKAGHEEMDELIAVYNLMIDQLRQERLQQVEKSSFLEKLIQASPTGIIILDFDDKIEALNPAAIALTGLDATEVKGLKIEAIPGKLAEELSILEVNVPQFVNLNGIQSFKCQKSTFIDKGFTRTFYTIEELTKEIYIREKAAYERVVKIMSHEVNNSIGAINSILNSCLNYQQQLDEDDREDYRNALQISIERNKNLSALTSNFARVIKVPEPVKQELDLIQVLKSVQILMEPEARKKELQWQWESDCYNLIVWADAQQMEQLFINIVKNAIEAATARGIIKVIIKANSVSILNTGLPIAKEVSQQLFSPFFSTKKNGQGIGLMLTREILMNHEFPFSLESRDGWTSFKICFKTNLIVDVKHE